MMAARGFLLSSALLVQGLPFLTQAKELQLNKLRLATDARSKNEFLGRMGGSVAAPALLADDASDLSLEGPNSPYCCPHKCDSRRAIVITEPKDKIEFEEHFECLILRDVKISGEVKMEGWRSSLMVEGNTSIEEGIIMEEGSGHVCIFDSASVRGEIMVKGAQSVHVCGDPAAPPKEGHAPSMKVHGLHGDVVLQARPNTLSDVEVQGAWGRFDCINTLGKGSSLDIQWSTSLISVRGVPNAAFDKHRLPLSDVSVYMAFEGSIYFSDLHLDHGVRVEGHMSNPKYGDFFGVPPNSRYRFEMPPPFFGHALMAHDCSTGPQGSFEVLGATAPIVVARMDTSLDLQLCGLVGVYDSSGSELSVHQCLGPVTVLNAKMEKINFDEIGFGGLILGGLHADSVDCSDTWGRTMDLGRGENTSMCHVIKQKDGRCEYLQECR